MAPRRRSRIGIALVVAALAVIVFFSTRGPGAPSPRAATPLDAPRSPDDPVAGLPDGIAPGVAAPQLDVGSQLRTAADRADFYLRQAEQYREQARYPKSNLALFTGQTDPIDNDNGEVIREKTAAIDERVALILKGPAAHATYPDPIRLEAFILVDGRPTAASLHGNLVKGPPNPFPDRVQLTFVDDGTAGDAVAGDLVYTWSVQPTDAADAARWAGFHNAYVTGAPSDDPRAVVHSDVGWHYSGLAGAVLTGRFRDSIVGGHLVIEAEIAVDRPGRYHLQMSLHGPDEQPLAWAQNEVTADYERGRHWAPLRVWGLVLRDAQIDGPYTVARAWLRDVSIMPGSVCSLLENAHRTVAYRWSDFSEESFDDPIDLAKADQMEESGRGLLE